MPPTDEPLRAATPRITAARVVLGAWLLLTVALVAECTPANPTVFRVNVGGPRLAVARQRAQLGGGHRRVTVAVPHDPGPSTSIHSTTRTVSFESPAVRNEVFRDTREAEEPEPQKWAFPVSPGEYKVNLYFAELHATAIGARTFGVWFEGGQVEEALDVFKVAGGQDLGIVRSHQATVNDDQLNVSLTRVHRRPDAQRHRGHPDRPPGQVVRPRGRPRSREPRRRSSTSTAASTSPAASPARPKLSDHSMYDPVTQTWTTLAPLPEALNHVQAVAFRGKIYYLGGLYRFPDLYSSHVYIYDPLTNTFSEGAPMPRAREPAVSPSTAIASTTRAG